MKVREVVVQLPDRPKFDTLERTGQCFVLLQESSCFIVSYLSPNLLIEWAKSVQNLAEIGESPSIFILHSGNIQSVAQITEEDRRDSNSLNQKLNEIEQSKQWVLENSKVSLVALEIADHFTPPQFLMSSSFLERVSPQESEKFAQNVVDEFHSQWEDLPIRIYDAKRSVTSNQTASDISGKQEFIPKNDTPNSNLPKSESKHTGTVFILLKPKTDPDENVAYALKKELQKLGHQVSIDNAKLSGLKWAQQVQEDIRQADVLIALFSESSVYSETLTYKIELSHQLDRANHYSRIIPVRIRYTKSLPQELGQIIHPLEFERDDDVDTYRKRQLVWKDFGDESTIAEQAIPWIESILTNTSNTKGSKKPIRPLPLEPLGGAVPMDSPYYIERPADKELRNAVDRSDGIVLLKGARQMGKTSLLARALHQSRELQRKVIVTDFQKFNNASFHSIQAFYQEVLRTMALQLELEEDPMDQWKDREGPNANFEKFLRTLVLKPSKTPVVWACDEFDRLLSTDFYSEVCGLIRSWHNERALDPSNLWSRFSVVIAYATEAHLLIKDLNQSPFNVGTRLALEDFTLEDTHHLNELYGNPLSSSEVESLFEMIEGNPYLIRKGLHEIKSESINFQTLEIKAQDEDGPFGDHLQRMFIAIASDAKICDAVQKLLKDTDSLDKNHFFRLRSAGIIKGSSTENVQFRSRLYENFLRKRFE